MLHRDHLAMCINSILPADPHQHIKYSNLPEGPMPARRSCPTARIHMYPAPAMIEMQNGKPSLGSIVLCMHGPGALTFQRKTNNSGSDPSHSPFASNTISLRGVCVDIIHRSCMIDWTSPETESKQADLSAATRAPPLSESAHFPSPNRSCFMPTHIHTYIIPPVLRSCTHSFRDEATYPTCHIPLEPFFSCSRIGSHRQTFQQPKFVASVR